MGHELNEAVGPELAGRIEGASIAKRVAIANAVASAAAELAGLGAGDRERPGEAAERFDAQYFALREAGDPAWEQAFARARAASSLAAAEVRNVDAAIYEAKHAGVTSDELAALVHRHL